MNLHLENLIPFRPKTEQLDWSIRNWRKDIVLCSTYAQEALERHNLERLRYLQDQITHIQDKFQPFFDRINDPTRLKQGCTYLVKDNGCWPILFDFPSHRNPYIRASTWKEGDINFLYYGLLDTHERTLYQYNHDIVPIICVIPWNKNQTSSLNDIEILRRILPISKNAQTYFEDPNMKTTINVDSNSGNSQWIRLLGATDVDLWGLASESINKIRRNRKTEAQYVPNTPALCPVTI